MPEDVNRQWTLASRPNGYPEMADFGLVETMAPRPRHGEVLVKTLWLSLDPYMRGRMTGQTTYTAGLQIGDVMQGEVVGRVVDSQSDRVSTGDIVTAHIGWQEYGVVRDSDVRTVDLAGAPVSTSLGVLGMPGRTAYFGLLDICRPRPGDTVVVSAASGAVGAVVGQLAKIGGCRVVGIAGSDEKTGYIVNELGFDHGINYKSQDVRGELQRLCPGGVDVYFDNVGGDITDAVLENLAFGARIAICGQISQYNLGEPETGPRNLRFLLTRQARMEGFLVFRFRERYDEADRRLAEWVKAGKLKYREDVVDGFENAPKAFVGMMHGANFGKLVVKVAE